MDFRILPPNLHVTAEGAISYFRKHWGISVNSIKIEEPIHKDIDYRPTVSAGTTDFHILCIEVSDSAYNNSLDAFVIDAMNENLPVKLFIAMRKDVKDSDYLVKMNRARSRGVGILEVAPGTGAVVQQAMSLSLASLRKPQLNLFPPRFREPLSRAETIFRTGSPDKGCLIIFEEIEDLFRRVARRTYERGLWNASKSITFDFEHGNWASLIELTGKYLTAHAAKCPLLKPAFFARIHGVTPYRNDAGHKPKNQAALIKRDRELRTRFESAADLLLDLITAIKPLRL